MKSATINSLMRKLKIWTKSLVGCSMLKFFPLVFSLLILIFFNFSGCTQDNSRKIKLAGSGDVFKTSNRAGATVLKVAPEEQKSLAIRYFKNHTGDPTLAWLERGLTDMLIAELSQSPYLNIITETQFLEVARKMDKTEADLEDRLVEVIVAGKANAEILLTGCISFQENLVSIQVEATDAATGAEIRKEKVEGEGLEKLFSMIDELSEKLRQFLREKGDPRQYASINLSEMTSSLEAFRCYSKALENREKFLFAAAEECLEEALKHDSTFAAVYLQLLSVKRSLKKPVNNEKLIAKAKRYAHKLSFTNKVNLELSECEMKGEHFKIISILEKAVAESPTNLTLRLMLAQRYRFEGYEEEALQEYEQIIDMDPNHKVAYNDMGYLFAEMGDFKTALYMLDKYQKLAPDEPNPHDSKGEILLRSGEMYEAAEEFKLALKILPGYYNSSFRLAEIYTEAGDQKKAIEYLEQGLKYVTDTGFEKNADFLRARIYWRFGEIDIADKYFSRLLNEFPLKGDLQARRIEMYRSAGKKEYADQLDVMVFEKFENDVKNSTGPYEHTNDFISYMKYTRVPLEKIAPLIEIIASRYQKSDKKSDLDYALDLCDLYTGNLKRVQESYREKIPDMFKAFDQNKYDVGWGSTWKYLFSYFDEENKGAELSQIFSDSLVHFAKIKNRKDLEFVANMAQARVYGRLGERDRYSSLYKNYGAPLEETFKICGPFREYTLSGFDNVFPPEEEIKLAVPYKSNNYQIKWINGRDFYTDGHVNLNDLFDRSSFATAYALIYIDSPDERKVQVRIGTDESYKFWLNNELIWQHYIKRAAVVDRDIVTVLLHPGLNKMLLKITNTDLDWGFYLRVTDEAGDGFPDLKFVSPEDVSSSLASSDQMRY